MNTMLEIQCKSVKNKLSLDKQCCNKAKPNEILCGKHLNSKNIIIYENMENEIDTSKEVFNKEELYEKILNNSYISVFSLRKSIKECKLNTLINTKQSKQLLINCLKKIIEKERFYATNKYYLILLQSFFRKWLIHRRASCSNDTDILTFTCKYEIPGIYFYVFYDKKINKKFGYDIRTLLEIIESDYPSCPYTFRKFDDEEKERIYKYKNKLNIFNINTNIEKNKLSYEEETDMKIKDVFYQINMLDNYTNHVWFKNLNLDQLIELYLRMEDIWNYRSSLTLESKKRIVNNGNIFYIPIQIIKSHKIIIELQNILLDDFTRLITEGIDREEKKLGAILILTGLVEVSYEAAYALPHLIQD
jgi:hypothetical protein